MWQWRPTRSTLLGASVARSTARSASPLARLKPNFESSCPVAMNSWVWAWTPGVMRSKHVGRGPARSACSTSSRSSSSKRVDHDVAHARGDRLTQLVEALVVAVQHARVGGHAGARARRAARRRSRRRAASPPRRRGVPSPGTGTPWWRRRRCSCRTRRPPRGSGRAGAPRRRRTAACRTRPPSAAIEHPPIGQPPVGTDVGGVGQQSAGERGHPPNVPGVTSARARRCRADPRPWARVRAIRSHSASRLVRSRLVDAQHGTVLVERGEVLARSNR